MTEVTDSAGFEHVLVFDGKTWWGTENLAHMHEPSDRGRVVDDLMRQISANPTIGVWNGYTWKVTTQCPMAGHS